MTTGPRPSCRVIRFAEANLPWRAQEQLETTVGLLAVAMVTYMVVWMRRAPKNLLRDTEVVVASALASSDSWCPPTVRKMCD